MKRWHSKEGKYIESPERVEAFLSRVEDLCREFNLSICHEDEHGAFIICNRDTQESWLDSAMLAIDMSREK